MGGWIGGGVNGLLFEPFLNSDSGTSGISKISPRDQDNLWYTSLEFPNQQFLEAARKEEMA